VSRADVKEANRTYPLDQIVEACRYVETGQKTGNVVISLERSQ
jgi:hypothetical protein